MWFNDLIRDTLKKKKGDDYEWSRTSLTMFSAWVLSCYMALYSLKVNGFSYEVFVTFVGVALGSKMTDALSKRWAKDKE